MRFDATLAFVNGAAMPDPVAAPATIAFSQLADLRRIVQGTGSAPKRLLLALEAPAAETLTVDLWALLEPPAIVGVPDAEAVPPASRVFFRFATGLVLTGGVMAEVATVVPPGGVIYIRRTADALTTTRFLHVAAAP